MRTCSARCGPRPCADWTHRCVLRSMLANKGGANLLIQSEDRGGPNSMLLKTRCKVCRDVLFASYGTDPLDRYMAGGGGWSGIPLAVCMGSWRTLWRRRWYHQICCGIHFDTINLAGEWYVFGAAPFILGKEPHPFCNVA